MEIISNEMNDKLAKELSKRIKELASLISITFDFGGAHNRITDKGSKDLILSLHKHKGLKNILFNIAE